MPRSMLTLHSYWYEVYLSVGLGSIGTTSMDRQSRKIDVQHERTSIAELDTAPPYLHCFPYPQITKEPTLFFKKTAAIETALR